MLGTEIAADGGVNGGDDDDGGRKIGDFDSRERRSASAWI